MTDERMGERLWEAIERLPIGDGGVVVRHMRCRPPIVRRWRPISPRFAASAG